jgi:hypothetical protein
MDRSDFSFAIYQKTKACSGISGEFVCFRGVQPDFFLEIQLSKSCQPIVLSSVCPWLFAFRSIPSG